MADVTRERIEARLAGGDSFTSIETLEVCRLALIGHDDETSREPDSEQADGRLSKRGLGFLRAMAHDLVRALDASPFAPNYLEMPMEDASGKVIVVVTLARPDGRRPGAEAARLRGVLNSILTVAERGLER